MPTFSAPYLARLAGATGFRSDTLEKVLRLGRLLDQIGRHPFLGERLALKGGTALNLFFGARAPRLSVDLDFNYVRPVERDEMLLEQPEVERALTVVGEGEGYRLQWGAREHAGRKTYLQYRNALGTPDRIEVDVNYLYRVPLQPLHVRDGWTPDPDFPCRARLVGLEEILAGKLLALVDRGAPRDLYDAAGLAAGRWPHDQARLRRLFVILSAGLDRPLPTYEMPHRASLTSAELEEALVPVLRGDEPTPARGPDHGHRTGDDRSGHAVRCRESVCRPHPVGRVPAGTRRGRRVRIAGAREPPSDAPLEGGEWSEASAA